MKAESRDLIRVLRLLNERETQYAELGSRVARGDATTVELAKALEQLLELQALAAAIRDKSERAKDGR